MRQIVFALRGMRKTPIVTLVAVLSHNTAMSTWWIAPALIFTVLVASLARSTPR